MVISSPPETIILISALALLLLLCQLPAAAVLLARLLDGPRRQRPVEPVPSHPDWLGTVSVVVPTLNEVDRLGPCLAGISAQDYCLREVIVVDSRSQDGTPELVKDVAQRDPRLRLITDDPLPPGWVGRPWALHTGFLHSATASDWVLGLDADVRPQPGLIPALLGAAQRGNYDLISLSPQFILWGAGELLLQPSLLMTLVYRFGPSGAPEVAPERVMANGQCFLVRRDRLVALDGYTAARDSFCDDVTLARRAAAAGCKVGFLDGARVLQVRMYEGARETWREWGRSLDLKDASSRAQLWGDLAFLIAVQGLPLPITVISAIALLNAIPCTGPILAIALLNATLLAIRIALTAAIAPSYDRRAARFPWLFWLSPLTDPLATLRIGLSSVQTPTQWRGRQYRP